MHRMCFISYDSDQTVTNDLTLTLARKNALKPQPVLCRDFIVKTQLRIKAVQKGEGTLEALL